MRWTNEYGFIRAEDDSWMDAAGVCSQCQVDGRIDCIDSHERMWCGVCITKTLDAV